MSKRPQTFNSSVAEQQVVTTARALNDGEWRQRRYHVCEFTPVFPRCGHRARNRRQEASLYEGLLTPRWLAFLFPAPAEGRSTSGVAVWKREKKKPSLSGRCSRRAKPPEQTQPVWSASALFLPAAQAELVFFQELPSCRRCSTVKLLQMTDAEFVKGLVYM